MTDTPTTLHPAERYAALVALRAGLADVIADANAETVATAEASSTRSFHTPYGPVNVPAPEDSADVDVEGLTRWLIDQGRDDELVLTPRPSTIAAFKARLILVNGEVVDKVSGETSPEYGRIVPGREPSASWPSSARQREVKAWARELFAERAEALTAGLRELTR